MDDRQVIKMMEFHSKRHAQVVEELYRVTLELLRLKVAYLNDKGVLTQAETQERARAIARIQKMTDDPRVAHFKTDGNN